MADIDFTFYYFPSSYYSLKAIYALFEKGVPFKERIVFIHFGEQNEDWYLQINPKGVVPVLQDGKEFIPESEVIINHIDKRCPSKNPLVPDLGTKLGQDVDTFRKLLDGVNIEMISFGVIKNQSLCTNDLKFPAVMKKMFSKEKIEKQLEGSIQKLQMKLETAPSEEEKVQLKNKIATIERRNAVTSDKDQVSKILDEHQSVFDELEAQLNRMKQSFQSADYWLCGSTFTAADVTASAIVMRFHLLGIDDRYFNSKRPLLCDYRKRLMERPAYKKMSETNDRSAGLFQKKIAKGFAKSLLKVGLVVGAIGAGVYIYRKYFK